MLAANRADRLIRVASRRTGPGHRVGGPGMVRGKSSAMAANNGQSAEREAGGNAKADPMRRVGFTRLIQFDTNSHFDTSHITFMNLSPFW